MKLLIITQKVDINDPILGFFHRWIEEFSKNFEKINVICLEKGEYHLPPNVSVYSLGKEEGKSRIKYIYRFYKYIFRLKKDYDAVFIHMNPIYLVLGGLVWKIWNKKLYLWYVHRHTNLILKIAGRFTNNIFTASKESFKLKTKKILYFEHAIDTDRFSSNSVSEDFPKIISTIGRITRIKNLDIFIKTIEILNKTYPNQFLGSIVGEVVTTVDGTYLDELQKYIKEHHLGEVIKFTGSKKQSEIPPILDESLITINLTPTGGWDKSVLESLAANRGVFSSNKAFLDLFGDYQDLFIFEERNPKNLASKIESFLNNPNRFAIVRQLSLKVKSQYDLKVLISKMSQTMHGTAS